MSVCSFFGHQECPGSIDSKLNDVLIDLIENHAVYMFYVGNQGAFDALVHSILRKLQQKYPHISCAVVLAYLPTKQYGIDYSDTMLPEGIETVPKRFAIACRNRWMVEQSDIVVTYVTHGWGGAAQFAQLAKQKKKKVINIPELF